MVHDTAVGLFNAGRVVGQRLGEGGPRAVQQDLRDGVQQVSEYLDQRFNDPALLLGDARALGTSWNRSLNPAATPAAPTVQGELRRRFGIGLNQGEALFDLGLTLGGGAEVKGIPELKALSKGAAATDYLPPGVSQSLADYMAGDYAGIGSHSPIPRSAKLPGGGNFPTFVLDSPLNRFLPPEGTPKGAFFRYHYAIDPDYYGGPVSKAYGGGGWSGRRLGWTKYGPVARAWYGTPLITKAAGLAGITALGWPVAQFCPGSSHP